MTLLLLIRHGENDFTKNQKLAGRLPGVHLNARGQDQARALGEAFKNAPLKALYASPLERAMETAAPVAQATRLEIQKEAGLIETNVGRWQGRSLAALRLTKQWKIIQHAPSRAQFPEGESFHECQARIVAALNKILRGRRTQDMIACVFHADPIKLAVAYYLGLPLDQFQRLSCDTGSVTMLNISEAGASLVKLNQRPPLDFLPRRK
ncbi:MAG: Phosphoserine phosphatase 1 [Anaerolineales bacterium]|nr:Phosphoserine phosphatase 1 [Anaerolineales bacterium]